MILTREVRGSKPCPPLPPVYWNPFPVRTDIGPVACLGIGIASPCDVTMKSGPVVDALSATSTAGSPCLNEFPTSVSILGS
jgi:hypothetical protein